MAVGFAVLFETGRRRVGGAVSRAQMNLPVICIYACTGSQRRREGWRGVRAVSTGGGARNRAERIFRVTRIALVPSTRFKY